LTILAKRIRQSFVFYDNTARHKPLTLSRLVRSEPDKHAPIWIANYQVDRHERRIANDLSKFVLIEQPWAHHFTRNGGGACPASGCRHSGLRNTSGSLRTAPLGFDLHDCALTKKHDLDRLARHERLDDRGGAYIQVLGRFD
jgi:hypothetical protein